MRLRLSNLVKQMAPSNIEDKQQERVFPVNGDGLPFERWTVICRSFDYNIVEEIA